MTTYNTYQEAKIANPECEIYQLERNGLFAHCGHHKAELVRFIEFDSAGIKCNPADYCMTVERFLADGYRFVDGDLYIDWKGCARGVGMTGHSVNACNDVRYIEDSLGSYILRAAVLEERVKMDNSVKYVARKQFDEILKMPPISQEPRIKVEYVKCGFNSRGAALDCFDNNKELYEPSCNPEGYSLCEDPCNVIDMWDQLYRRIETPMTERDELFEALKSVWIVGGVDGQEQLEKIVNSGLFKLVN